MPSPDRSPGEVEPISQLLLVAGDGVVFRNVIGFARHGLPGLHHQGQAAVVLYGVGDPVDDVRRGEVIYSRDELRFRALEELAGLASRRPG